MAETCNRKLVVEVCTAKNLMPKDGEGTASAYAIVDFDGQRRRTKTKFRDLNPQWDEKFEFMVHDVDSMVTEVLELNLYNDKKVGKRSTFLGKVKIAGTTFAKSGEETLIYYPLEKRSVFSQIKGEIGLKVSYVDEINPPVVEAALPEQEKKSEAPPPPPAEENPPEKEEKENEKKSEEEKPAAAEKPPETAKSDGSSGGSG
ncbi:C2 calcium/lipid-binding plant phosphoribosyltransferase family protein [Actinidia rufa]|uniref:C2 calcium/lipid-binding plant phosphoribosyltransferase family protein n=1 Tax=Actinidia rufa TaxID=165716 RepID=A0A7J0F483_9ERIC|nr:C2 calcium/lipid-binding plant phosphoribosyltransferase family protein [Actinidia rufa]